MTSSSAGWLTKRGLSRNVLFAVAQVFISGTVFLVLYRYLFDELGVEQVGVWALVLAAASVSRIAEFGLSGGVVKFVSQSLARNDQSHVSDLIQTVTITLAAGFGIVAMAAFPILAAGLVYLLPSSSAPIATAILPYALVSLWAMVVVSGVFGALDGWQRTDLRCSLLALSHVSYLALCILWVPEYGLKGVAFAQVSQALGLLATSWLALKWVFPPLPMFPNRWLPAILRRILRYGINLQIIAVMVMLFDPMTKALMSKFGGLSSLGYYELASKLVIQLRAILVEANRVLVPVISRLHELNAKANQALFIKTYRLLFFLALIYFSLIMVAVPTISVLWLKGYEAEFVQFALMLTLGWFLNTLIAPAFFSNLGTGELRENVISHVLVGIGSFGSGVILGTFFGGLGVVAGNVLGLGVGSIYLLYSYMARSDLRWQDEMFPAGLSVFSVICALCVVTANVYPLLNNTFTGTIVSFVICAVGLTAAAYSLAPRNLVSHFR